ncbi:MAG TPA: DUF1501 domain-containing protein, partial [Tepidisphaeraceae bacterium]|nr:DUF1501 domain-containing protein [Tepidisphaeraceae bacterium]
GGNDALNTVIPLSDPRYAAARPTLAIGRGEALELDGTVGLHPAMTQMHELFKQGQLAIIQGVGYPNSSRSHFRSREVWHRGMLTSDGASGWLGRYCEQTKMGGEWASMVYCGKELPEVFKAEGMATTSVDVEEQQTTGAYPQGPLGAGLGTFARMIKEDAQSKLFYVSVRGFDTHARQAETHGAQLGMVSAGIGAFLAELKAAGRDRDVMVMVFSEFGRRVKENTSAGTDHGSAGVMFIAGGSVRGGLYGKQPSLTDLHEGDLRYSVDFRDCYATVLEGWLGTAADRVMAHRAQPIAFV